MIFRHALYYLVARGLPGLLNFLAISVFTRMLSPGDYGLYAVAMVWVGLVNVVFFQWIRLTLLRFLPAHAGDPAAFLATIVQAYLLVVIVTGLGGACLIGLVSQPGISQLVILAVPLTWAQAWFELNLEMMRSQLAPLRYGLLSGIKAVASLVIGVLLIFWGFGMYGPLLGLLVGLLLASLIFGSRAWPGLANHHFSLAKLRPLLAYGLPLSATFALAFIVSSSDRLILAWLVSDSVAGIYAAGYDLVAQVITLLMLTVNLAAYPLVLRALEGSGKQAAEQQLRQNGVLLLAIGIPVMGMFAILAPQLVAVLLGEAFRQGAVTLLPWVALATFLDCIRAYHYDLAFQLGNKTISQVWITLAAALINILFNFLWIPQMGMLGAAYATVLSYGCALILSAWWGRKLFQISLLNMDALKIVASGVFACGALWPMREGLGVAFLVGQVLVGGLVYLIAVFLLNVGNVRKCRLFTSSV